LPVDVALGRGLVEALLPVAVDRRHEVPGAPREVGRGSSRNESHGLAEGEPKARLEPRPETASRPAEERRPEAPGPGRLELGAPALEVEGAPLDGCARRAVALGRRPVACVEQMEGEDDGEAAVGAGDRAALRRAAAQSAEGEEVEPADDVAHPHAEL